MNRIALPFSLIALAGLAACTTEPYVAPAPVAVAPSRVVITPAPATTAVVTPAPTLIVPQTAVLRTGSGRIEAIQLAPNVSASAPTRRVAVRMDDGTMQLVDLDATGLALGDRIEFMPEGYFRRAGAASVPPVATYPVSAPPASTALRAGFGQVESISAIPGGTAAAGASGAPMRRVGVRMSDGGLQYIETDVPGLGIGDRIELTSNGYLLRR